ncbi:Uncharacterized protein SCF082_LOCUS3131, partial [Durusdinium trenchii]
VLKLAARFERLIKERQLCESAKEKNEEELLSDLICKYNSFRANSALRKWQITSDGHQAVWCIIIGMTETSRSLLRSHLDHNKWEESGYSESILRLKRHMLNNAPKGLSPFWEKLLTVTPDVQQLHFRKYNHWWSINSRRVKKSMRVRIRWTEDQWTTNVNQCCIFVFVLRHCQDDAQVTGEMIDGMTTAFLNGDYSQDLDAILVAKPVKFTPEMTGMWQDHVGRALLKPAGQAPTNDTDATVDEAEVLHMRDQIQAGLGVADSFMERRLLMLCSDKNLSQSFGGLIRRSLADAGQRFDATDVNKTHYLGFTDLTKYGRLSAIAVNEVANWRLENKLSDMQMEGCLSRVSTLKGQLLVVQHQTMYDGVFEKVLVDLMNELQQECHLAGFSETTSPAIFQYAVTGVKDKLLEEWKQGKGQIGLMTPKFQAQADLCEHAAPRQPQLKMCKMDDAGNMAIPKEVRDKWLSDPVRNPDWRVRLKNFDSVFSQPLSSGDRPNPQAAAADVDLAQEAPAPPPAAVVTCPEPAKMTANEFQQKYPNPDATITLTLGAGVNITCYVVGANAFLSSQSKVILPGVQSGETAKPLFMYAGGSWISESAKAQEYLGKPANENKAVEFRLESSDSMETTSQGTQDTAPMTIYHMIHSFEKRGILDLKVTGHSIERPPAVRRGEEADRLEVQHEAHSVFKPNAVTAKQCKATNVAGLLGYKSLQASQHLQLVWRVRHFAREKVVGPAKPLWYLRGSGFTADAGSVYQVC